MRNIVYCLFPTPPPLPFFLALRLLLHGNCIFKTIFIPLITLCGDAKDTKSKKRGIYPNYVSKPLLSSFINITRGGGANGLLFFEKINLGTVPAPDI